MRTTVCGLLLYFVASLCSAEQVWRSVPQHMFSHTAEPIFVDLDGDGAKEVVYLASASPATGYADAVGVLRFETTRFERVDVRGFGTIHEQPVAFVSPAGGERMLISIVADGFDPGPLFEVGEIPLRILRTMPDNRVVPELVADVDGDGKLEIVGRRAVFRYNLVVHDYQTGELEWSVPARLGKIIATQLDSDPALEIVFDDDHEGGIVLDGATGLREWTYPGRFRGNLLAGRFVGDPAVPTFATIDAGQLRLYRGLPYSPLRAMEIDATSYEAAAIDVDHDGVDEVVARSEQGDMFNIVEPSDGSYHSVKTDFWDLSSAGIGRVVPLGPVLAAYSGYHDALRPVERAQVLNLADGGLLFDELVEGGPYGATGFGDLDGDGRVESVVVNRQQSAGQSTGDFSFGVTVWSELGGALASRADVAERSGNGRAALRIVDLDGLPGDEIVVHASGLGGSSLIVLDGRTLADRWRLAPIDGPGAARDARVEAIDVDGDGEKEIVLLQYDWRGAQVSVYSGVDGALIWRSDLLESASSIPPSIMIHNVDPDPLDEIIVAGGQRVYAFGATSGLLEWSFDTGEFAGATVDVTAWGTATDCRIAVAMDTADIIIRRCSDQAIVDVVRGPEDLAMMIPTDAAGSLAIVAGGAVWTMPAGRRVERYSEFLGANLGGVRSDAVHRMPDGELHMLLGSNVQVHRIWLKRSEIFANGFERLP